MVTTLGVDAGQAASWYRDGSLVSTVARLTFMVGVRSPASIDSGSGRIAKRRIVSARVWRALIASMPDCSS
jgi:hypothetical protein